MNLLEIIANCLNFIGCLIGLAGCLSGIPLVMTYWLLKLTSIKAENSELIEGVNTSLIRSFFWFIIGLVLCFISFPFLPEMP